MRRTQVHALMVTVCSSIGFVFSGAAWPPDFDEAVVVDGLDQPTAFAHASDGRIFITEKDGRVRVVTADGQLLTAPFATVSVNNANDRGLLGIALHPNFPATPWVYLAYTTEIVPPNPANGFSRVHRITRWTANGNVAVPGSELILVDGIPSDSSSHTGGALEFGPDGKLYVATGDGSQYSFADPLALRAQSVDELVGKILRINDDGSVPADNPFYTSASAQRSKVWQKGLRNPFKATFRPGTGKLYVNDVGWDSWEETNFGAAGANFGWPCYEGNGFQTRYRDAFPNDCAGLIQTAPVWTYVHASPLDGGAITGGAWIQGGNYPATYEGKYFVADYALGWIKYLSISAGDVVQSVTDFATGDGAFVPVDIALAPDGDLHYLNIATDFSAPSGSLNRITYVGAGNHAPRPAAQGTPAAGYAPLPVVFTAQGTTDADGDPLSYHWKFGDGAEADGFTAGHTYAANGSYLAVLQVGDAHVTREAKVRIAVGSLPPAATIATPPSYRTYEPWESISFSGSASDPDEGTLPATSLRWTVIQHHEGHQHPYQDTVGASGSFLALDHGIVGDLIWYELVLTATDGSGLSDVRRTSIYPNRPPVADAGPDRTVPCALPAAVVRPDGSSSLDPDQQPITYAWTRISGPPVTISGANTATPSFAAPRVPGGASLVLQLAVDDGHVASTDTVAVTVPDLTDVDGDGRPACGDPAPADRRAPSPARRPLPRPWPTRPL